MSYKHIIPALIKAKMSFKPLAFDRQGARNKYASFGAIKNCVEEALNKNDIHMCFTSYHCTESNLDIIRMMLIHSSGESLECSQALINDPNSPIKDANQRLVASTTYAMRNLARQLLSLHAEEADLDEYSGEEVEEQYITEKQVAYIQRLLNKAGEEGQVFKDIILEKYKVDDFRYIPYKDGTRIIDTMVKKWGK